MPANVETMFYVREKPWHGPGTEIQEAPTSADALVYAGLDWLVEQKNVYTEDGWIIPGYKANMRSTDDAVLGIVSERYKIVQNADAFRFTDDLLGEGVTYETAGALQGGRKVWMDNTKLKNRMSGKVQNLQKPVETVETAPDTALAPVNSSYLALTNNALDIIRANLKSQPLTLDLFDIVKSPSGGSTVFSVPGLAGDEPAKGLTGIILAYTTPRAYWDTPEPVEGTPPVCLSQNSIISHDGKACALCPYNDFGSKDGESNAKACKESVLLFLLRPDSIIPLLVRVPVTSKVRFLKYSTRLLSTLTPISSVVTKITLEKATSKAGKPYLSLKRSAFSPRKKPPRPGLTPSSSWRS